MTYAYLFKYIILGDKGIYIRLLHICYDICMFMYSAVYTFNNLPT